MPATILAIEDELAIQELISFNLKQAGHFVLVASSAELASRMIKEMLPDLILLDWMLPGMSGIEFARKLKNDSDTRGIPVIMLSARSEEQDKAQGLEAGVDDYITKPFSLRELNARIKVVLRRRAAQMTNDLVEVAGLVLDPLTHRVTGHSTPVDMGPSEFRLLHFFMTHPERVHSRAQLLDSVWGNQVLVDERTVDVHIGRLRRALGPTQHDALVQTIRGVGYRLSRHA